MRDYPTSVPGCRDHGADLLPLEKRVWRTQTGSGQATQRTRAGERQAQAPSGSDVFGEANPEGSSGGKLLSPERRRGAVEHARRKYGVSEKQACRILKQSRGTQRYQPAHRTDEDALTRDIIALASEYGR
jgi:hypothetical protein